MSDAWDPGAGRAESQSLAAKGYACTSEPMGIPRSLAPLFDQPHRLKGRRSHSPRTLEQFAINGSHHQKDADEGFRR